MEDEVVDSGVSVVVKSTIGDNADRFCFMYNFIANVGDLSGLCIKVLLHCASEAEHNTNIIYLIKHRLGVIAKLFDVSVSSVRNCVYQLKHRGFLISFGGNGSYVVNPIYFWRGDSYTRKKIISMLSDMKLIV